VEKIPNPTGLGFLESLMYFIDHRSEVEKVLAEIGAARDEANAKIAAVGTIKQIEDLKAKTLADRAAAENVLADAKRKAENTVQRAETRAKEVQAEISTAAQRQKERKAGLDDREKGLAAREEALRERSAAVDAAASEASQNLAKAEALSAETDRKLAAIRVAIASAK
jgi:F0F1-type ATP synthase membrane subunit b/b'